MHLIFTSNGKRLMPQKKQYYVNIFASATNRIYLSILSYYITMSIIYCKQESDLFQTIKR
jgi:hypothetical protein